MSFRTKRPAEGQRRRIEGRRAIHARVLEGEVERGERVGLKPGVVEHRPGLADDLRRRAYEVAPGAGADSGKRLDDRRLAVLTGEHQQAREADLDRFGRGIAGPGSAEPEHMERPFEHHARRDLDYRAVLEQGGVEGRERMHAGVRAAGGAAIDRRAQVLRHDLRGAARRRQTGDGGRGTLGRRRGQHLVVAAVHEHQPVASRVEVRLQLHRFQRSWRGQGRRRAHQPADVRLPPVLVAAAGESGRLEALDRFTPQRLYALRFAGPFAPAGEQVQVRSAGGAVGCFDGHGSVLAIPRLRPGRSCRSGPRSPSLPAPAPTRGRRNARCGHPPGHAHGRARCSSAAADSG